MVRLLRSKCGCGWDATVMEKTPKKTKRSLLQRPRCTVCGNKVEVEELEIGNECLPFVLGKLLSSWASIQLEDQYQICSVVLKELKNKNPKQDPGSGEVKH